MWFMGYRDILWNWNIEDRREDEDEVLDGSIEVQESKRSILSLE